MPQFQVVESELFAALNVVLCGEFQKNRAQLKVSPEKLVVRAASAAHSVEITLPTAKVIKPGEVVIFVDRYLGDQVSIGEMDRGVVRDITFSAGDDDEFPDVDKTGTPAKKTPPSAPEDTRVEFNGVEFARACFNALVIVEAQKSYPKHALLQVSDNTLRLTSMDRVVLHTVSISCRPAKQLSLFPRKSGDPESFGVLVSRRWLKLCAAAGISDRGKGTVSIGTKSVTAKVGSATITTRIEKGDYPNCSGLFVTSPAWTFIVDREWLLTFLFLHMNLGASDVRFLFSGDGIFVDDIYVEAKEIDGLEVHQPLERFSPVSVNKARLTEVLQKGFCSELVSLTFGSPFDPVDLKPVDDRREHYIFAPRRDVERRVK